MSVKKYSWLSRFFIFCSGAELSWLRICPPKEDTKYFSIGSLVFMTAVFAFISSSYAFYNLINPTPLLGTTSFSLSYALLSVSFGLLWAVFIFFLDRAFVSSMSKNSSVAIQILGAIPRLALALLISISVSKPLEIYIFRQEITNAIVTREGNDVAGKTLEAKDEKLKRDQESLYNKAVLLHEDTVYNRPSQIEMALIERIAESQAQRKAEDQNYKKAQEQVRRDYNFIAQTDQSDSIKDIMRLKAQRPLTEINIRLGAIDRQLTSLHKQLADLRAQNTSEHKRRVEALTADKTKAEDKAATADAQLKKKTAEVENQNKLIFNNAFINEVIALEDLSTAMPGDSEARKKEKTWQNLILFIIWMLFLMVEIAPISMKLIMSRGEYDIVAQKFYDNMEAQIEPMMKAYNEQNAFYSRNVVAANEALLKDYFEKVSTERHTSLAGLIGRWRAEEDMSFIELTRLISARLFNLPLEVVPIPQPAIPADGRSYRALFFAVSALVVLSGALYGGDYYYNRSHPTVNVSVAPMTTSENTNIAFVEASDASEINKNVTNPALDSLSSKSLKEKSKGEKNTGEQSTEKKSAASNEEKKLIKNSKDNSTVQKTTPAAKTKTENPTKKESLNPKAVATTSPKKQEEAAKEAIAKKVTSKDQDNDKLDGNIQDQYDKASNEKAKADALMQAADDKEKSLEDIERLKKEIDDQDGFKPKEKKVTIRTKSLLATTYCRRVCNIPDYDNPDIKKLKCDLLNQTLVKFLFYINEPTAAGYRTKIPCNIK